MIRRMLQIFLMVAMLLSLIALESFADTDIDQQRNCAHCGMDRKLYGYSRMLIRYADGSQAGVCSLHCTVTELNEHKDKKVENLLVADRDSHTLIEAGKASWVIGGRKRGVMTQRPKWAFATSAAALAFIAGNGGVLAGWDEVLAAAREDAAPKQH